MLCREDIYMSDKKYIKEELFNMDPINVYKMIIKRELKIFPAGFWSTEESMEKAVKITKWVIEKKLRWSDEEIKMKFSLKTFKDNYLYGMLVSCFNGSPYSALNYIYPNKFKAWELRSVPNNYWSIENGVEATKWLIEDILEWDEIQVKNNLSSRTFKDNNLSSMFRCCFNESTYKAIDTAYPNKFKKEDLRAYTYYEVKNLLKC